MEKTAKISHLFLAANNPPGQKLFTAAIVQDQKLCTTYSYIEGLSNPSGYRGAIEGLSKNAARVQNSKKRAKTRADSDLKQF